MDENKSERVIVNVCSSDDIESKSVRICVNTSEEKYAKNETKDGESLVTDNSVINAPSYFKLFECSKKCLNKLDATCE